MGPPTQYSSCRSPLPSRSSPNMASYCRPPALEVKFIDSPSHTHSGRTHSPQTPLGQITEARNVRSRKGTGIITDTIPSSQHPPFLEDFLNK